MIIDFSFLICFSYIYIVILASGILKGYDALINLVLDNAIEYVRDSEDHQKITEVNTYFHFLLKEIFLFC